MFCLHLVDELVFFFDADESEYYCIFLLFSLVSYARELHICPGVGSRCWSGLLPPPPFFLGVAIGLFLRIKFVTYVRIGLCRSQKLLLVQIFVCNHTFPEYLISTIPHPRRIHRHTHRPRKLKELPQQPFPLSLVVRLITPHPLVILPGYTAPYPSNSSILILVS